ncbi:helix-turn-helix domain-containing protein [Ornithinibacillus scapharcae]|uniref:helix-turn-helix domain-containing protein n=1 Tax=Ornithinibacillus scapharcae TaxID=1147159 RepID=UPI000225B080|nr:helix-turn-helix domain-containing protein [Ornithinibacillus scapharcae]
MGKYEKKHDEDVMYILEKFDPKIKRSLSSTTYQEREDLEQEIKIKIIEKLSTVKFKDSPRFWDLLK